jgi:IS30 family transposase
LGQNHAHTTKCIKLSFTKDILNQISVAMNQFKIDEHRKQVASLLAQSLTERQIAAQLNVSQPTVNRDVQALKEMAQQFVNDLAKSD